MALDGSIDGVRARVLEARPLRIRGGGSKDFYGNPGDDPVLEMSGYRGVVAHDPSELVLTARCGTPLSEIESLLAEHGQRLPFEPPHFGNAATLGGCVAAGLAGPGRMSAGSVRDFVLGAVVMDGRGTMLRFGGQVMKNVAGYDVARMMAGSMGVLGPILEVSIKLLPRPPAEVTLALECDQARAIRDLNTWAGQPLPISASAWHRGQLFLRLAGAGAAVDKASALLGGVLLGEAQAQSLWDGLREHRHAFFSSSEPGHTLWRLSLPSTCAPLDFEMDTLIEWGGAQRWLWSSQSPEKLREQVRSAGGHAVAFRRGVRSLEAFDRPSSAVLAIHQRLKAAFDPAGIFNRGRLFPEL